MRVSEYTAILRRKFVPYLVPSELSKGNKFANGLPADIGPMVKQSTTLKSTIWAAQNDETQLREKGLERAEV